MIRRQVEEFEVIGVVDDEIRGIVARNWPRSNTLARPARRLRRGDGYGTFSKFMTTLSQPSGTS
jgi:hypothetical protein